MPQAERRNGWMAGLRELLRVQAADQFDEARHARGTQRVIVDLPARANPFEGTRLERYNDTKKILFMCGIGRSVV